MANDLRKFVNPKFLKTIDLALLRRLFERQPPPPAAAAGRGFDLAVFDSGDDAAVRAALAAFFEGPEDELPPGLVADLHHIAELGTEHGMNLLLERARRRQVVIEVPLDAQGEPLPVDPKHFALLAFLDHRPVFDAASDMLAKELRSSFAEYVGRDEGVEPRLDIVARAAFEAAAAEMFRRDHRGAHCRVGWYEDGDQVNLIVTHGAPVSTVPVIEAGQERVIRWRRSLPRSPSSASSTRCWSMPPASWWPATAGSWRPPGRPPSWTARTAPSATSPRPVASAMLG